jgi:hypothetical protein
MLSFPLIERGAGARYCWSYMTIKIIGYIRVTKIKFVQPIQQKPQRRLQRLDAVGGSVPVKSIVVISFSQPT